MHLFVSHSPIDHSVSHSPSPGHRVFPMMAVKGPLEASRLDGTMSHAPKFVGQYQLGDCIGKGAFGAVYRGLNIGSGEVVAIKQVRLADIPASEADSIMSEIDLLKKLHHDNIVKYLGFIRTSDYLYIVLEFCENGSLQTTLKKFGRIPENLVSVYIYQVLEGLIFLHAQGVIHRDIKGANILSTKEGHVKLGDFGVATGLNENRAGNNEVVGSPYWMAPEVVEMSGITTASDIWSVGCTVIELLIGEPPYFGLSPMAALFKIVQEDHPPIPEHFSPPLKDFLIQCFQKDPNLRTTAKKLIKHPWLQNVRPTKPIVGKTQSTEEKSLKFKDTGVKKSVLLDQYVEKDEGDMDDFLGIDGLQEKIVARRRHLTGRTVASQDETVIYHQDFAGSRNENEDFLSEDDEDEQDPFGAMEEDDVADGYSKFVAAKTNTIELGETLNSLSPEVDHAENMRTIQKLLSLVEEADFGEGIQLKRRLIPLLSVLESSEQPDVHLGILKLINILIRVDNDALNQLCTFGAVPLILDYAHKSQIIADVHIETAKFIRQLLLDGDQSRRILFSCRGLDATAALLKMSYSAETDLHWITVEVVQNMLNLETSASRNDFSLLLLKTGAVEAVVSTMPCLLYDTRKDADMYLEKCIDLIHSLSASHLNVKTLLASRSHMHELTYLLGRVSAPKQLQLLRAFKNLSNLSVAVESWHRLNACKLLVEFLGSGNGHYGKELRSQSLFILYNYCRVNKARLERAAQYGIIPLLKRFVEKNDPLKQFALPILCDLAHASKPYRELLWKAGVFDLFLDLLRNLQNDYWIINALEALQAWMTDDDLERIQKGLQANVEVLVSVFVQSRSHFLASLVPALQKLLITFPQLAKNISKAAFMQKLVDRLDHGNVMVKLGLLKMLSLILKTHGHPQLLIMTYDIQGRVEPMAQDDSVLVSEIAQNLLREIQDIGM